MKVSNARITLTISGHRHILYFCGRQERGNSGVVSSDTPRIMNAYGGGVVGTLKIEYKMSIFHFSIF